MILRHGLRVLLEKAKFTHRKAYSVINSIWIAKQQYSHAEWRWSRLEIKHLLHNIRSLLMETPVSTKIGQKPVEST